MHAPCRTFNLPMIKPNHSKFVYNLKIHRICPNPKHYMGAMWYYLLILIDPNYKQNSPYYD